MSILFYSKEFCPFCKKLEDLLLEYSIPFKKVTPTKTEIDGIKNITKMTTFPMVMIGEECIGGYTEFYILLMTNGLEDKLKENNIDIKVPTVFF